MKQLLTANVATNLYWLGRYIERIELTLFEINKAYDKIIDVDKNAGVKLYQKFNIELKYTGVLDFLDKAIKGEHAANLANLMVYARENTIIARPYIDSSTFGEIIELHTLFQKISNSTENIDYKDIDTALSLISEIWGAHEKRGHRKCSDYFFKLGKLIEEVDFRLRFDKNEETTKHIIDDIYTIFKILDPNFDEKIDTLQKQSQNKDTNVQQNLMDDLYKKVNALIVE
ncbi:MAG: Kinase [uncultured Sulfurovum sp.]|uniref:Kinase n=1 Tax=uncultured Sulfurovum sp. TaxID=269237 RepID=A0A6S6SGM7_9BACT|nr:MAG: Kinase [uncultured Sulfurovum sp.]